MEDNSENNQNTQNKTIKPKNDDSKIKESKTELTEEEKELYDRQIRLWGMESQKRLKTAKVLISGLSGIGAEVTKNLILSGVHSVKLHDDKCVTEEDFCSQFLIPQTDLGKNRAESSITRARNLNPIVEISSDTEPLSSKDYEFFKQFDIVVIMGASNSELIRINIICRSYQIKFFAGDAWGMFGYFFTDLQDHTFFEDVMKHKVISEPHEEIKTEVIAHPKQREIQYPAFSELVEFDVNNDVFKKKMKRTGPALILLLILQEFRETLGRDPSYKVRENDIAELIRIRNEMTNEQAVPEEYLEIVFGQISPAVAIVGGVLAQEVIKVITKKEAPHRNVFLFDPIITCGFVEAVGL